MSLDIPTRGLVRAAAAIAASSEAEMRQTLTETFGVVPNPWVEELILQSYLFCGFPRALNAAREWRRVSGVRAPAPGSAQATTPDALGRWRAQGEATCATVYGRTYERLRHNIRDLHPELDDWMIVDGYGKVLSRPGLDLERRELCVVAACAATGQERQLHAHFHGALNSGADAADVGATLDALDDLVPHDTLDRAKRLWARVSTQDR